MNKIKLIEAILDMNCETENKNQSNEDTFFEIGKVYAFRTVTMIYTGRVKATNQQEILVDEAAWIPETERWADFAATGAHREAEPYTKPVIISRGALLDSTEIPSVIRKQK